MSLSREALCAIAQDHAERASQAVIGLGGKTETLRAVVIVTDELGDFVGVGSSTTFGDTQAILACAIEGQDLRFHNSTSKVPKRRYSARQP